ncbi:MAG: hypothetical protein ACYDAH_10210 [Steroidobacteraceae bacterium]
MNRNFKKQFPLIACLTCGVFALAHAAEVTVDAEQLGIVESVLHFCGPVDPASASKLKERVAKLVQGASEAALAKVRESDEYKHSYEMVDGFVAQVDEHNAKTVCTDELAKDK